MSIHYNIIRWSSDYLCFLMRAEDAALLHVLRNDYIILMSEKAAPKEYKYYTFLGRSFELFESKNRLSQIYGRNIALFKVTPFDEIHVIRRK